MSVTHALWNAGRTLATRLGTRQRLNGREMIFVHTHALSSFQKDNPRLQRYRQSLTLANQGQRDSFLKQCRYHSLQQICEHLLHRRLAGDFAECGCYRGHSSHIIASLMAAHQPAATLHIFDSFEGGLSDRSPQDASEVLDHNAQSLLDEKLRFASLESQVAEVLSEFTFVKLYKGWIPDRFAEIDDRQFALVHIDVDLYQPIIDSLQFFYPRTVPGGALIIDDYGWANFPGAKAAVNEFLDANHVSFFYEVPTGSAFIIK